MRHPEEDYEDQINALPRHERERAQPDGMNAPPDRYEEMAPCLICGEPKPEGVRCDCWERKP